VTGNGLRGRTAGKLERGSQERRRKMCRDRTRFQQKKTKEKCLPKFVHGESKLNDSKHGDKRENVSRRPEEDVH